jgi:hypothetical protein
MSAFAVKGGTDIQRHQALHSTIATASRFGASTTLAAPSPSRRQHFQIAGPIRSLGVAPADESNASQSKAIHPSRPATIPPGLPGSRNSCYGPLTHDFGP